VTLADMSQSRAVALDRALLGDAAEVARRLACTECGYASVNRCEAQPLEGAPAPFGRGMIRELRD
jgi:hypothetical protein